MAMNVTRVVEVPFMTNYVEVNEGEELIIEAELTKPQKPEKKRRWTDAHKDLQKERGDAKKKAAQKKRVAED